MKVVVLHAYSASNSGDGLLVTEALELVTDVHPTADIVVFALDPESFAAYDGARFRHPLTGTPTTPPTWRVLSASVAALLRGSRLPAVIRRAISSADLVVGVGGGYMRGANFLEALKMLLVHAPQTEAGRLNRRVVYLPQSVGPFRVIPSGFVRGRLREMQTYFVRDDRSLSLLPTAIRVPDNALLALGDGIPATRVEGIASNHAPSIGLVARELSTTNARRVRYLTSIRDLQTRLHAELLVQARARGNNDDVFYQGTFGQRAQRTLVDGTELNAKRVSAVVSVRLHGAIQSIRNGVPAVHLSYERKGWGAFEDLGIDEYVHNAFDFDPEKVAAQARQLAQSPEGYWNRVDRALGSLRTARADIARALRGADA
jgi:polysaccharide pyruvyl transferase WcaK-like protein